MTPNLALEGFNLLLEGGDELGVAHMPHDKRTCV